MAWTTPRTWVSGEVPTASVMNTHIRDNLLHIKTVGNLIYFEEKRCSSDLTLTTAEQTVPGTTHTVTTTVNSAKFIGWGVARFQVDTTSSGVNLRAWMTINGVNRGEIAFAEDSGTINQIDGTYLQCWEGPLATAGAQSFLMEANESPAGGVHKVTSGHTKLVVAVYE